ncbi:hypothetical protein [Microvirga lotononidis]|uniref:Uncharacterized protein n=1 Tax=Microvirga lotononidis TaxID=864069 RepID=I4YSE2_9HYPH|nr:hypothetical protein [Microvirga lotononidis]EIM26884.1 hypothetical protein MicloDRAFT_00034350 [Microvirga lotononidis]WQO31435.1 hypothetical protein U0023_34695 [Microvirga lotononidis]
MAFGSSHRASAEIAHHLSALAAKVDEIARRAGVSASERLDLETTLASLPWPERRRLGLILESARVSATSEAVRDAVAVMLGLASEVWARTPPPAERNSESDREPERE